MKIRYPSFLSRRDDDIRRSVILVRLLRGLIFAIAFALLCSSAYQRSQQLRSVSPYQSEERLAPTSIHLIAERHCGSKWITAHLNECFGQHSGIHIRAGLTRWKHWFQENNTGYVGKRVFVVTQFRNVYQWVAAMNYLPYHSISHYNLTWQEFVTREWNMPKIGRDLEPLTTDTECQERFKPSQVNPCLESGEIEVMPKTPVKPLYELRQDGSGRSYDNILQLRSDKIKNFLSIKNFGRVIGYEAVRYEDMVEKGTASLIRSIERQTGLRATCKPIGPSTLKKREMPPEYFEYMRQNVDWESEALIGYYPEE